MILVRCTFVILAGLAGGAGQGADQPPTISAAKKDSNHFLVHEVQSPYQSGKTAIRVLLPDQWAKDKQYPVIYLLPVEAGMENRYGDGLLEVKKLDLHNRYGAIFVAPTFSHLPWYADHPAKTAIRQETYLLRVVLPFIEKTYAAVAEAVGRLLLGFSKSGWGAFSLLLRHPDLFGKAAAWDAPLMMDQPNRFGMGDIFGTQENFEKYQIAKLLEQKAEKFQQGQRLVLLGYGSFRDHHEKTHALMVKLKIDHVYRDGPARKHDWPSGWVREAVELLLPAPKQLKGQRS
jgi:S-formylglutathione hydrolase FrmB